MDEIGIRMTLEKPASSAFTEPTSFRTRDLLSDRIKSCLDLLLQSADYAGDLSSNLWEFAVELGTLRRLGLTRNDLRWLVAKGWVAHAEEMSQPNERGRAFRESLQLMFTRSTCFALTPTGIEVARTVSCSSEPLAGGRSDLHSPLGVFAASVPPSELLQPPPPGTGRLTPCWDRDRQQLRVGGVIVKQFKVPAANQEVILATFQEEDWPARVDDPLSPAPDLEPKRRLHDTVNSLNRSQKCRLIRFSGDGSGQGICWEFTSEISRIRS